MRFTYYQSHPMLPDVEVWKSSRGFWSFLIVHDKRPDCRFFCSYRDQRTPEGVTAESTTTVMFCGDAEMMHRPQVSPDFGYANVDDAMRACEVKYKALLIR